MIVFIDGKFVAARDSKVSVFDHGFLYADGVYETLRTYNGRIWQLNEHLKRLKFSADKLGIKIPWGFKQLGMWIEKTVNLNGFKESRIRMTLTRGQNNFDFVGSRKPFLCIQVALLKPEPRAVYAKGVKVVTVKMQRLLPEAKTISLLPMVLARRLMKAQNVYEAIFVDDKNTVKEGTVTNVFIVVKGVLFTPAKGVLAGTTCAYIVKLARCLGLKVQMRGFKVPALQNADEVFITNAARGIVPVVQVNRKAIGSGRPGKITKMLRSAMLKDTSVIK